MKTEFDEAIRGLRATGASVSTHRVVGALERHGREEGELLERYQRFVDKAESPAARYLVEMILADERRHHRLLEELAVTLAWGGFDGSHDVVPGSPFGNSALDQELKSETRDLLDHERRDRVQLRRMRRRLRSYGDEPMWILLLDLMLADTEKHIHMLRFILRGETPGRRWWPRWVR